AWGGPRAHAGRTPPRERTPGHRWKRRRLPISSRGRWPDRQGDTRRAAHPGRGSRNNSAPTPISRPETGSQSRTISGATGMGLEVMCAARVDGRRAQGTAHLESDHVRFRGGATRVRIPFGDIRSVTVDGGSLVVQHVTGELVLEIGP